MAYKIGTTIVIDDSGNIDWARITGAPTIGDILGVTVANAAPSGGQSFGTLFRTTSQNCACSYNCYVTDLAGGGTTGTVTITANRGSFNCNCACRC